MGSNRREVKSTLILVLAELRFSFYESDMHSLRPARLLMMIALIAIMARSVIPGGYMPEMNSGKLFHITICTMDGPKIIAVDDKQHPVNSSHVAKETCAFGLLNHSPFYALNAHFSFAAPVFIAATQTLSARNQFVRAHIVDNAAQPRAPPVTA